MIHHLLHPHLLQVVLALLAAHLLVIAHPILQAVIPTTEGKIMLVEIINLEHLTMAVVVVTVVIQVVAATHHPTPIMVVAILVAVVPLVINQQLVPNQLLGTNNFVFC